MRTQIRFLAVAVAFAFIASGCTSLPPVIGAGYSTSADAYTTSQARQAQQVRLGTVVAVRAVAIKPEAAMPAVGSGIGAVIGGLAGHQVGGGKGNTLATVAGAVLGASAETLLPAVRTRNRGFR